MVWERTLVIVLVVWALGGIRTVRLRAIAYTLPIPITVVLAATGPPVVDTHAWGIVLLAAFFRIAVLVSRIPVLGATGWSCVAATVAAYLALAIAVTALPPIRFWAAVPLALAVLLGFVARDRRRPAPPAPPLPSSLRDGRRALTVVATAVLAAVVGGLIGPLVATFPYAGIPLAIDSRGLLPALSQNVSRNALALLAFVAAVYPVQSAAPWPVALGAGWLAFAVVLLAVQRLLPAADRPRGDRPA